MSLGGGKGGAALFGSGWPKTTLSDYIEPDPWTLPR